jgi:hypothetical protein
MCISIEVAVIVFLSSLTDSFNTSVTHFPISHVTIFKNYKVVVLFLQFFPPK